MYKIICISSALIILCLPTFGEELQIKNNIEEFDTDAIKMILTDTDDEADETVDFLKQNVNIIGENRPLLDLIGKKEDATFNIHEALEVIITNDLMKEKVSIGQVQNIIRQGFGCAVSKATSLYLFVMLHDLKKLKIDLESLKENADESEEQHEGPTQSEPTEDSEEVAGREEHFFEQVYVEEDLVKPNHSVPEHSVTEYNRLGERFGIRSKTYPSDAGPSNQINEKQFTHPFLVYFLFYSEYLWAGILRKQVIYNIDYTVQFEMFKVIFGPGNSASLMTDDHINDVVCVLEEMLKMVDEEISNQCVDHKGSLVKKYEIFNETVSRKFMMYLSDLDNGKNEDLSRFHLDAIAEALRLLFQLYGEGELKSVEAPANELHFSNCPQRYKTSTKKDVVARLRAIYTENDNATTGQENDKKEPTETN
ncbi:uncharacterized protein LOC126845674 [Adelges cooleyi]|uniref:uncharacterized protein LOC126845674 n=1 Tax=Adelges cooleyi TaxID=133065 RepID=UPI00218094B6|nr:uncharacterized protein LOC126845674 [Adelges cooleyi]